MFKRIFLYLRSLSGCISQVPARAGRTRSFWDQACVLWNSCHESPTESRSASCGIGVKIIFPTTKHLAYLRISVVLWILACLISVGCTSQYQQNSRGLKIQAVTLDARNQPSKAMLPKLRELGITHVTLVQFGFQQSVEQTEIRMNPDAWWYSESDRGAKEIAQSADSLGMKIILKPHLWLGGYHAEGQPRNEIKYADEESWTAWEADYTGFLMHYAHLAEEVGAEILVIGTELARSAHERPQYWRGLIENIRSVYQGKLTYAANWWEEYEHIEFWDMLDYVGVQAYFELSDDPDPTSIMLAEGWNSHKEVLSSLSAQLKRPVLFTEIGYRNVADAAAQPWRWPSRNEADQAMADDDLQAQLYTVFFDEVWNESWFSGAILWK